MPREIGPLQRDSFVAQELMESHPPVWRDHNKAIVAAISCPAGAIHAGTIGYSRWDTMRVTGMIEPTEAMAAVEDRPGFYRYEPVDPDGCEWHVNFADPHLFVAYGSSLFAQDEIQCTEHPALGALLEALRDRDWPALTVDQGRPTPVLVTGVERRCAVTTKPDRATSWPHGLYGNAFARAPEAAVVAATRVIDPPTHSNIIAMAALPPGYGTYEEDDIAYLLVTAYSGFRAAVLETRRTRTPSTPAIVHTGHWGCGAFGGNRELMATIQAIAAHLAGVVRLVFHTGARDGADAIDEMRSILGEMAGAGTQLRPAQLVEHLAARGFEWGVSDGN